VQVARAQGERRDLKGALRTADSLGSSKARLTTLIDIAEERSSYRAWGDMLAVTESAFEGARGGDDEDPSLMGLVVLRAEALLGVGRRWPAPWPRDAALTACARANFVEIARKVSTPGDDRSHARRCRGHRGGRSGRPRRQGDRIGEWAVPGAGPYRLAEVGSALVRLGKLSEAMEVYVRLSP
ncbi:MAG: hypothetical protein WKF75_18230, partial [Singulisphaera sp.]